MFRGSRIFSRIFFFHALLELGALFYLHRFELNLDGLKHDGGEQERFQPSTAFTEG